MTDYRDLQDDAPVEFQRHSLIVRGDRMTVADIIRNTEFHEANSTRSNGTCYVWRKNGALKLWKTRPDDFRQPVKYGLRTYDAITPLNADYWVSADKCLHCAKLKAKLTEKADAR